MALLAAHSLSAGQTAPPAAGAFAVSHQPVDCVVADKHPRFEAQAPAGMDIATARVFFQGASQEWYSVGMKAEGPLFSGLLPSPKKNLKEFRYYIELTARGMETARTADRVTRVVASASECRGIVAASGVSTASILVAGPAGGAAVPSGFAPAGLVAGGGISGTTLAVAGAVVVGGGVVAATQLGGDDEAVEYAGTVSGQNSIAFGPCNRVERYTFELTMELTETGGVAGSRPGTYQVVSATNCTTGPQTGATTPFGIGQTPISRSGASLSFTYTESGQGETVVDFKGSLQGDIISGTVTLVSRVPNATGISVSTPMVSPVTLTRK
jgi:hypothetical protein